MVVEQLVVAGFGKLVAEVVVESFLAGEVGTEAAVAATGFSGEDGTEAVVATDLAGEDGNDEVFAGFGGERGNLAAVGGVFAGELRAEAVVEPTSVVGFLSEGEDGCDPLPTGTGVAVTEEAPPVGWNAGRIVVDRGRAGAGSGVGVGGWGAGLEMDAVVTGFRPDTNFFFTWREVNK
ncbi:hypothetical protein F3Y22_tig00111317pilonHSYRG00006 [Hibiscus syriacus]|uniref:Uncharacterized protein n=1 Tax=Hibiscus syriacus TaxID=106335 RepID=A0A6A2YQA1_HIBSY|nr:hypothetical protein F3Y22_tig00111317pilonHSYRG00006 [Hibiscus syriacus]